MISLIHTSIDDARSTLRCAEHNARENGTPLDTARIEEALAQLNGSGSKTLRALLESTLKRWHKLNAARDACSRTPSGCASAPSASSAVKSASTAPQLSAMHMDTKIEYLLPQILTVHPALSCMPEWAEDDEEFTAFVRDVKRRGILDALLVDSRDRVVDGRHRLRAARLLNLDRVPIRRVEDSDVHSIVLAQILTRRHYSKGGRAYLVAKFLRTHEAKREKSYDVIAAEAGVSLSTFKQALQLIELFLSGDEGAAYRTEIETKILEGETSVGAALAGWAGRQATKGKAKTINSALDLWNRGWEGMTHRFKLWSKLDDAAKASAQARLDLALNSMPDDLLYLLSKRAGALHSDRKKQNSETK